jgi:hypothetical protein
MKLSNLRVAVVRDNPILLFDHSRCLDLPYLIFILLFHDQIFLAHAFSLGKTGPLPISADVQNSKSEAPLTESLEPSMTRMTLVAEETVSGRTAISSRGRREYPTTLAGVCGSNPSQKSLCGLLGAEAPNRQGESWATVIAEALLQQASRGDVRAISELANRVEGRSVQGIDLNSGGSESLAERSQARQRGNEVT